MYNYTIKNKIALFDNQSVSGEVFVSANEYNNFLTNCIHNAGPEIDKNYIIETFNQWFSIYHEWRCLSRSVEILQALNNQPHYIYIDSPNSLTLFTKLSQAYRLDGSNNFRGLILEDELIEKAGSNLLSFKVFSRSQRSDVNDFIVFSLSGKKLHEDRTNYIANDYLEKFIDISRYNWIKEVKGILSEQKIVLYADYKKVQTLSAIAGYIRRHASSYYKTVLLSNDLNSKAFDYDDFIHEPFFYLWPLIFRILNPDILHINVGWGTQGLPFALSVENKHKTVIDFYDVLTFISDSALNEGHPEKLSLTRSSEKYLFTEFDNIIHRCSEKTTPRLKKIYSKEKNIVPVFEYLKKPVYISTVSDLKTVKLAFGGDVVKSNTPNDPYYERFFEMVKYFCHGNLRLDIYPNPFITGFRKSQVIDELILNHNLSNVYSCTPLSEDEFVEKISEYDYGVIGPNLPGKRPMEYGYGYPFKTIAYLRAGLPLVVPEDFSAVADLVREHNLGVVYRYDDCSKMPELLSNQDLGKLKANVVKFREKFSIEVGAKKVMGMYSRMLDRQRKMDRKAIRKSGSEMKPGGNNEGLQPNNLSISESGFISAHEYNNFLIGYINKSGPDIDKEYIIRQINQWFSIYHEWRFLSRTVEMLQSLSQQPYYIHINSINSLTLFTKLSQVYKVDKSKHFRSLILEDELIEKAGSNLHSFNIFSRSQCGDINDAVVFSLSGEGSYGTYLNYIKNDYLDQFIDLSRFNGIKNIKNSLAEKKLIFYPLYREIHTVPILTRHIRKHSSSRLKLVALTNIETLIDNDYDEVIFEPFSYLWPLVFRILDPHLIHVNVGWGIQALPFIPFVEKDKTVIDFYEVLSFLPDSYFEKMHSTGRQVRSAEKHLIQNFNNVMHLCFEGITTRLKEKYAVNSDIISVTEYLDEPTYSFPVKKSGVVRLVYGGCMVDSPDDIYYQPFMTVVKYYTKGNLRLYIYNSPYVYGSLEKRNGLDQIIQTQKLSNIYSCKPLKKDDFIRKIAEEYDYGVFFLRSRDMTAPEYNYFMPYKFLTYLRAGLPVILYDDHPFLADLVEKYNIGIVLKDGDLERLPKILNNQDMALLKANVVKYREKFRIEIGAGKVLDMYDRLINSGDQNGHKDIWPKHTDAQQEGNLYGISDLDGNRERHDYFEKIIDKIASVENRLYYRDQTPESLNDLVKLVDKYKPTKIVELGTLSGLSLRTWLLADTNAGIIAIDLSFTSLRQSQQIIPLDLSRVKLIEQNILQVDFSRLWGHEDRVLLYIDAHDMPNVPVMEYVLLNAVPTLPTGSMVVVDDLWHSSTTLSSKTALQFFKNTVINEIDPLQCFQGFYAPYWKGGFFFGFREVTPLMEWVNKNQIDLVFKRGIKSVAFEWKKKEVANSSFDAREFERLCGDVKYNPVEILHNQGEDYTQGDQQLFEICKQGAELYAKGRMDLALVCFQRASDLSPSMAGAFYAQGVILARGGKFEEALQPLGKETANPSPHPNAQGLLKDIHAWMDDREKPEIALHHLKTMEPITIFTMPKAFKGHIDIIQRNAIKSWTLLKPRPEIILLGDDEGTSEIAKEFSLKHVPDVERNELGTPLLNSMFAVAEANSSNSIIAYVNADIILMNDFAGAIETILKNGLDNFLMVGQRWDFDLIDLIDFKDNKWEDKLKSLVNDKGTLHAITGVDYFVFFKGAWGNIPPFALGRTAWDNWLIQRALDLKMHIIDATQAATIVHQNHDYEHMRGGKQEAWNGEEAKANLALAGGYDNIKSIAYARWIINKDGRLIKKVPALNEKGEELFNKGDIAGALAVFKKAIEIDPSFATAYNNLGVLYWQHGEVQKAIAYFKKALKIDPNNQDATCNYGTVLTSLKSYQAGIDRSYGSPRTLTIFDEKKFSLSIIVTVYQKEHQIGRVIKGIIDNTTMPFELVVVYDGCTDRSEEIVNTILSENRCLLSDLKTVYTPDVNEVMANNAGMRSADGTYFILVQDDMEIIERGWEQKLIFPMETWDDVFAVSARNAHSFSCSKSQKIVNYTCTVSAEPNVFKIRDAVNRGPVALHSETMRRLNYLDERYAPLYFDDMDLCIRAYKEFNKVCGVYQIQWRNLISTVGPNENAVLSTGGIFKEAAIKNRLLFWERYHNYFAKGTNHDENRAILFQKSLIERNREHFSFKDLSIMEKKSTGLRRCQELSIAEKSERTGETTHMVNNNKKEIKGHVNKIQKIYDDLWKSKLADHERLKNDGKGRVEYCADFLKAHNRIGKGAKILDIGCGRGTLAHYLDPEVCLYGIDISEKAVSDARKVYKQADVVDLNTEKLPYEDNFFDLVITLDVIEHVFDPLFFLKEIYRVTKSGGELILSTPNILNENLLKSLVHTRRFPKTSGDSFPYDGGYIHFFTYQDIFDLMENVDFNFTSIGPLKDRFDYEFKEPMVWVSGKKI